MTSHAMTSQAQRFDKAVRSSSSLSRVILTALTAGLIGALATTAANASDAARVSDAPAVSVKYSDLNLATDQGNVALYKRIVSAARQVCPIDTGPNARLIAQSRKCVDDAVARAVSDIESPQLAALQAARSHRIDRG